MVLQSQIVNYLHAVIWRLIAVTMVYGMVDNEVTSIWDVITLVNLVSNI